MCGSLVSYNSFVSRFDNSSANYEQILMESKAKWKINHFSRSMFFNGPFINPNDSIIALNASLSLSKTLAISAIPYNFPVNQKLQQIKFVVTIWFVIHFLSEKKIIFY